MNPGGLRCLDRHRLLAATFRRHSFYLCSILLLFLFLRLFSVSICKY